MLFVVLSFSLLIRANRSQCYLFYLFWNYVVYSLCLVLVSHKRHWQWTPGRKSNRVLILTTARFSRSAVSRSVTSSRLQLRSSVSRECAEVRTFLLSTRQSHSCVLPHEKSTLQWRIKILHYSLVWKQYPMLYCHFYHTNPYKWPLQEKRFWYPRVSKKLFSSFDNNNKKKTGWISHGDWWSAFLLASAERFTVTNASSYLTVTMCTHFHTTSKLSNTKSRCGPKILTKSVTQT